MISPLRALVLSPSASHPQDYGNRNRVWQVTSFLKGAGYAVDFLFYPFEAEWNEAIPPEADDMHLAWDSFWIVPPSIPLHRLAQGEHHEIDEWWDEAIGNFLQWLFARRTYDLFLVNYTFLSRALTYAPTTTIRVLETHDLFSGRKEMLATLGVGPEFFYTTREREKIAFDRADIVIAIKDSEAALIQGITDKKVLSLPFFPSTVKAWDEGKAEFSGLSIGFVGALNSINIANFQSFLRRFDPLVRLYCPPLRLLVAGNVCRQLQLDNPAFAALGRVDAIDDFYAQVDVVVAPYTFSTGIKIKVGEALAYGKGVVATVNGFDGYPALDPMHALASVEDVCRALVKLAFDGERREELIRRSRLAARLAKQSAVLAFGGLSDAIRNQMRRIVFVVDAPYWAEAGFRAARLVQWAQLCGFLKPVIVCHLTTCAGTTPRKPTRKTAPVVEIDVSEVGRSRAVAALAEELDRLLREIGCTEIMLSVDKPWAGELCRELIGRGHAPFADLWCAPLADLAAGAGVSAPADLWMAGEAAAGASPGEDVFETTPLRYPPDGLGDWRDRPIIRHVVAVRGSHSAAARCIEAQLKLALRLRDVPLEVIDAEAEDPVEALYRRLQSGARPFLLVSVAAPPRLRKACLSLALIGGIAFRDLDGETFPLAMPDRFGNLRVSHSCFDLLDSLVAAFEAGADMPPIPQASDTGWSRLWKTLERRLAPPAPADDESLGGENAPSPDALGASAGVMAA